MRKIFCLIALLSCLLHTACENKIDLGLEKRSPRLIMNTFINCDSVRNYLYLSLTGPYTIGQVDDATVEVQVNGATTEILRPDAILTEGDKRTCFSITSRFSPGDVVRIDARTADGKHHAWAEVTVPHPIPILKVDTIINLIPRTEQDYATFGGQIIFNVIQYKITIQDRPQENNFYRLAIESHDTIYYKGTGDEILSKSWRNYQLFGHRDIVLTDGQPRASNHDDNLLLPRPENVYSVFNDHRFTDKEYTLDVYTSTLFTEFYFDMEKWHEDPDYPFDQHPFQGLHSDIDIQLLSITETEYYYLNLLNVIDSDAFDEVLNEPISFPSNVHGGTGIVGISSRTTQHLTVDYNVPL